MRARSMREARLEEDFSSSPCAKELECGDVGGDERLRTRSMADRRAYDCISRGAAGTVASEKV